MNFEDRIRRDIHISTCPHCNGEATIRSVVVFPAEHLPETPPRIISRNCDQYNNCNLFDKVECPEAVGHFQT